MTKPLEDRVDSLEEYDKEFREDFKKHMDGEDERWEAVQTQYETLDKRLEAIENVITKFKGFIGGIVFIISCLWAFISTAGDFLKNLFQ